MVEFSKSIFQVDLNSNLISKKINFIFNRKEKYKFKIYFIKKYFIEYIKRNKKFIFKKKRNQNYFMTLNNNIYVIAEIGVITMVIWDCKKLILAAKMLGLMSKI